MMSIIEVRPTNRRAWRLLAVGVLVLSLLAGPAGPPVARASVTGCQGSISPQTVAAGSATDFQVLITNNDPNNAIQWIEIDTPAGYFTSVNSIDGAGWSASLNGNDYVVLTGSALNPGSTLAVTVNATAFMGTSSGIFWYTHVSDDPSGANSSLCDGDFNTSITNNIPPPTISNIALANLTDHAVTISWDTDVSTVGSLSYSAINDGGGAGDPTPMGHHSFTLSNLKANTLYHFSVIADDQQGNVVYSNDNTFLTPLAPPAAPPPVIVNNITNITTNLVSGVIIKDKPTETVPPVVNVATSLAKPFSQPPKVTGTASDNEAVAKVEYSLDGGRNWLPVDSVKPTPRGALTSASLVDWQFTPAPLDDGNYQVVVRATDTSSNLGTSTPATMVIDRLPPQTGSLAVALGPQILEPAANGVLQLVADTDYRLTASAVGGPISLTLEAVRATTPAAALAPTAPEPQATFSLTQAADSGLWNGYLSFHNGGTYQLVARGLDGAGNRTTRVVMTVRVAVPGHVLASGTGKGLAGARLTVFVKEPASGTWQPWQAEPYGQTNPQTTDANGGYGLMLPTGEYYLQVTADHFVTYTSDTFSLDQPTPVASTVQLRPALHLGFGKFVWWLPGWSWASQPLKLNASSVAVETANPLIGQAAPAFQLKTLAGATVRDLTYTGKPTVFSFVNTWSPDAQDQLSALAEVQQSKDVNVVPIFVHQTAGAVSAYVATAGYQLSGLADPDGTTVVPYQVGTVPYHVFVDRSGTVKTLMVRVLSSQELLTQLGEL